MSALLDYDIGDQQEMVVGQVSVAQRNQMSRGRDTTTVCALLDYDIGDQQEMVVGCSCHSLVTGAHEPPCL